MYVPWPHRVVCFRYHNFFFSFFFLFGKLLLRIVLIWIFMCFTGAKPTSEMFECRNNNLYCSARKYNNMERNCSICMESSPHSLTTCECVLHLLYQSRQPNVLNRTRIMCIKILREERRSVVRRFQYEVHSVFWHEKEIAFIRSLFCFIFCG